MLGERKLRLYLYRPLLPDPVNTGVGKQPYTDMYEDGVMRIPRAVLRGFFCLRQMHEAPVEKMFAGMHTYRKEKSTMEASVAIQSLPAAENDEELIRIVDEVIAYIAASGYNYYVGPFETTIEGPYDELMDIVKECQHIAIRAGAPSVAAYVKISYKPEGEVLSIERKIGKYHQ